MLGGKLGDHLRTALGRDLGQLAPVEDPDGGLGAHHRHLRGRPGEHGRRAQAVRVHGDVGATVGLAGDNGDPGHGALGERVQQLRAAPDHALPFLAHTGQIAGDVDQDDQRYAEGVAHPHEAGRLLRGRGVQAAAAAQRVVGHHAHRPAAEPAQGGDDVRRPAGVQFDHVVVEDARHQWAYVVGAARGLRQQVTEFAGLDRADAALLAEQHAQLAGPGDGGLVGVAGDGDDPAAARVHVGPAQAVGGAVLTGHRPYDVGAGDEDLGGRAHHDDVGQRGAVGGTAGGGAEHQGDLGDAPGAADRGREHPADPVEGGHSLPQPGPAGMPDPDYRAAQAGRRLDGVDDPRAALASHRSALDGRVGGEGHHRAALDGARSRQHTGGVRGGEGLEGVGVEELGQPGRRSTRVGAFERGETHRLSPWDPWVSDESRRAPAGRGRAVARGLIGSSFPFATGRVLTVFCRSHP